MVWDLSDLSDPTLVTTDPGIDWPTGVTATADALFVFNHFGESMQVFDITDPFDPRVIGTFGRSERYFDVESNQNYMVLSGWPNNLEIYEIPCDTHSSPPGSSRKETGLSLSVSPNPFNPRTTITFSVDHPQNVEFCIFDMTGKRIVVLADRVFQAGGHSIDWQGKDLHGRAVASGTYLVHMKPFCASI